MEINEADARVILAMDSVCEGEGIGPDSTDLLNRILEAFPTLPRPHWMPPL
jgi:hypothetical protein